MNSNFINNDDDFQQFVDTTLNNNTNNTNNRPNIYEEQIKSILATPTNQLLFTKLFTYYFTNRPITKDYQYASDCCICMDTSNYCIKICNCSEVKYCFKCFKEYVKTSILADPIKINSVINSSHSNEPILDIENIVSCSICRKAPMLELIKPIITQSFQETIQHFDIGSYLHSLDFFSETMPHTGDPKWYLLFNQDSRIRYNLVPLELLETINNNSNNSQCPYNSDDNDELKLRKAGMIYIFEIKHPTYTEHKQILDILRQSENQTTNRIKTELLRYNPSRLIML